MQRNQLLTEPTAQVPSAPPTVLVVDDNMFQKQAFCMKLNSLGVETDEAFSGQEAICLVEARFHQAPELPYELIFMDYEMPRLSGIEATK